MAVNDWLRLHLTPNGKLAVQPYTPLFPAGDYGKRETVTLAQAQEQFGEAEVAKGLRAALIDRKR
jgi:hypothetical protein